MSVIEVDDVAKSFWLPSVRRTTVRERLLGFFDPPSVRRLDVLRSVSFDVAAGESVAIMGRNGSGKSTLLKILCGIYVPDHGRLTVRAAITPILELGVGWNPDLDAVDNILLLGTVMGMTLRDAIGSVDEILAFAELEPFANLALRHFSSGMASRLAYAVAFKAVREVLVLDEVFAVGDARFKARCEERYRQLRAEGHTVVLVSHDRSAVSLCDRGLLVESGRIVATGTTEEIYDAYMKESTHAAATP